MKNVAVFIHWGKA